MRDSFSRWERAARDEWKATRIWSERASGKVLHAVAYDVYGRKVATWDDGKGEYFEYTRPSPFRLRRK